MKFLFDEQLSPALVRLLADVYPSATHVHHIGLGAASDTVIWNYAAEHGFTVVSKDSDFQERSFALGAPPKVIGLRIGNAATRDIAALLRANYISIRYFHDQPESALLVLP
jgi:predicted nuclease of predicted toxin-antitoxin system